MESASPKWLAALEGLGCQNQMDYPLDRYSLDEIQFHPFPSIDCPTYCQNFSFQTTPNISCGSVEASQSSSFERPAKLLKTSSLNSCTSTAEQITTPMASTSSSSRVISFGNSIPHAHISPHQFYGLDSNGQNPCLDVGQGQGPLEDICYGSAYYDGQGTKKVGSTSRPPSYAHDHVIAERRRRENLSQKFIALSAVVPCLRKMDKASVIRDSVKYLKLLQEREEMLEKQVAKNTMGSFVFVKTSQFYVADESSSTGENSDGCHDEALPQIEARVSDSDVLIRILSQKQKGLLSKILDEIERHRLSVIKSNVLPIDKAIIDVTVVAKMNVDFAVSVKDLLSNLQKALAQWSSDYCKQDVE